MQIRCLRCGTPITGVAQFCPECAAAASPAWQTGESAPGAAPHLPVSEAATRCPVCGSQVPGGAAFCSACGRALTRLEYAGFWIRLVASIIDGVLVGTANTVIGLAIDPLATRLIIQLMISIGYTVGFWILEGATPGKMMMGIRIVMADGSPLEAGPAVLRYIGYYLNLFTLGASYLMIALRKDKRGLHDLVAGTAVVRGGRSMLDSS